MTSPANIDVAEASLEEKPILRHLLELYLYDFSEFDDKDVGPHGLFGYRFLDHYWTEPDRHPYLIRADGLLAGFALVNRHTVTGEDCWCMAEFFVMKKYRNQGVGEHAAHKIFDLWPGLWQVPQLAAHPGSHLFWRKVIGRYTGHNYQEVSAGADSPLGPIQIFESRR